MKRFFNKWVFLTSCLLMASLIPALESSAQSADAQQSAETSPTAKEQLAEAQNLFKQNFKGAWKSYWTDEIEQAQAVYLAVTQRADATNVEKIEAWNGVATCWLERMDVSDHLAQADAAWESATRIPGLTPEEQYLARKNQAIGWQRQGNFDRALGQFRAILTDDLHIHQKTELENRIAAILIAQGKFPEARAFFQNRNRAPLDIARMCMENGDPKAAEELYLQVLNTPRDPESKQVVKRNEALLGLMSIHAEARDWRKVQGLLAQHMPALLNDNPGNISIYRDVIFGGRFTRFQSDRVPELATWVANQVLARPELSDADFVRFNELLVRTAIRKCDFGTARQLLGRVFQRETLQPAQTLNFRIYEAVVASNDNPGSVEQKVIQHAQAAYRTEVAARKPEGDKPPQEDKLEWLKRQEAAITLAGHIAMEARYFKVARALQQSRERMLVTHKKPEITCTFIPNGPRDVSSFATSAWFRDAANRGVCTVPYGDQLQFLLDTDAALTGRVVTQSAAAPSSFVCTCDESAVYFFFHVPVADMRAVVDGLRNVGGFEAYLASSPVDPYHCFLIDMQPTCKMNDLFNTQYDNAGFRRVWERGGTAHIEFGRTQNAVCAVITVPWKAFFDRIPTNGTRWQFEAIAWEGGGRSWGGSNSVHQRSSFGDVVFANLTPENLNAIRRTVVVSAWREYQRQLSPHNGFLEIWKDPELGDQTFYAECVKPLETELTELGQLVKPEMTLQDVDRLYREAVPRWMNVRYTIADLRREWLQQRWTQD